MKIEHLKREINTTYDLNYMEVGEFEDEKIYVNRVKLRIQKESKKPFENVTEGICEKTTFDDFQKYHSWLPQSPGYARSVPVYFFVATPNQVTKVTKVNKWLKHHLNLPQQSGCLKPYSYMVRGQAKLYMWIHADQNINQIGMK